MNQKLHDVLLELRAVRALFKAGMLSVERPDKLRAVAQVLRDFGPVGAGPRVAMMKHGARPALWDEYGELSFNQLEEQVNRLANTLQSQGAQPGQNLGILCRNHRGPLLAMFAASRTGMNTVWLNTAFSAKQAGEVAAREGVDILVYDADLATVADAVAAAQRICCNVDDPASDELIRLIASADPTPVAPPERLGKLIQLTSGTTGLPKGAARPEPKGLTVPGGMLERLPFRSREATVVAPPLFHGTGLTIALLTLSLGSKLVLRRKFEPTTFLDDIETHKATGVAMVPIMLQRTLALGADEIESRDLSSLRVLFCAGSQLPAKTIEEATALLGDVVHNLYGSTEVSATSIATPADLRTAPTCVGRPMLGVSVRILDDAGRAVKRGATGRIFVRSTAPFEGYTGGGGKEIIDGHLSSGDVGHLDRDGRLFIDGRDDEMIVSGGENVFPAEVEDALAAHPAIIEAAAIGVDDEDFGQRLSAFVVLREGATLTAVDVQDYVKENLARYKAPRDVLFLDELPRNSLGKVLKRELVKLAV